MNVSADGQHWDEEGCFVYKVVAENGWDVGVRSWPDVGSDGRTNKSFSVGDLVSIDLIRHSRVVGSDNGPFLRLSDGSGWVFEFKQGERIMTPVRVWQEQEPWSFYGYNYLDGIALRLHPMDSKSVKTIPEKVVLPMQQVHCDARVINPDNGVIFYRVQGTTKWIFDKRGATSMILPVSKVSKGLFAYRAVGSAAIRSAPRVDEQSRTTRVLRKDQICVGNALVSGSAGDGPFLRLTDGSGWLFAFKKNETVLEELFAETGRLWVLRVDNTAGIALRKQPIDNQNKYDKVYEQRMPVVCDVKIACPASGVNFYRVKGTDGWVFDSRGGKSMMTLTSSGPDQGLGNKYGKEGWSIDFVRGVAAAFAPNVQEISLNKESRVISFAHREGTVRINVYYTTRTIGTAMDHPSQGKTQLFRRNCSVSELSEIFRNPRVHTGKGYQARSPSSSPQKKKTRLGQPHPDYVYSDGELGDTEDIIEGEDELRNNLIECENELSQLMHRKMSLCRAIKESYDDPRERKQKWI